MGGADTLTQVMKETAMQSFSSQVLSDLILVISKVLAVFKLRVCMYRGKPNQNTQPAAGLAEAAATLFFPSKLSKNTGIFSTPVYTRQLLQQPDHKPRIAGEVGNRRCL